MLQIPNKQDTNENNTKSNISNYKQSTAKMYNKKWLKNNSSIIELDHNK